MPVADNPEMNWSPDLKEDPMVLKIFPTTAVALMLLAGPHTGALAQATDEQNAETPAPSGEQTEQGEAPQGQMGGERMGDRREMREHMREMRRWARGGMGMPRQAMKILFAITDANGDGSITFEEVTDMHRRIFNAMDANKDGNLTLEEIEAFWR